MGSRTLVYSLISFAALSVISLSSISPPGTTSTKSDNTSNEGKMRVKILSFNTWLGGLSVEKGFEKIVKHLKHLAADIIALQEVPSKLWLDDLVEALGPPYKGVAGHHNVTYADNAIITKHSIDNSTLFEVVWGIGATITLSPLHQRRINFVAMHLNYRAYGPYAANNKAVRTEAHLRRSEHNLAGLGRQQNMEELLRHTQFQAFLNETDAVPTMIAGDFNTPSHLDWVEENRHLHGGWVFEWPCTKMLEGAGFTDSFRHIHPNVTAVPGLTWSPVAKNTGPEWDWLLEEPQDRVDFIFYKGGMNAVESEMYSGGVELQPVPNHVHNDYPSDHSALYTLFEFN